MTSWQIGEFILNRFEITGILRGGMGLVYVLQDRHTGKSFAAKTYLSTSEGSRAAFEREALNWVRLTPHPNVVEALFVEHLNSVPFIFLQYVNGGDLRSQITQGAMADAQKLLTSALAICSGMEHAFKNGIKAHLDLKPENCLIDSDGMLKVSDFGLSVSQEVTKSDLHRSGTLPYMAPERFLTTSSPNPRMDVYSFGVILYEMLTDSLPFEARSSEDWIYFHTQLHAPSLKERFGKTGELADRCLAKDPKKRPQDFSELTRQLTRIYEQLIGHSPSRPSSSDALGRLNDKGISLMELGKYQEAMSHFDRAIASNRSNPNPWNNKGNLLRRLGKHEAALAAYRTAIKLDERNELAWSNQGLCLLKLGRSEEAVSCFQRAIQLEPSNPVAWCNLGSALRFSNPRQALKYIDQALSLDQSLQIAWYNKGLVLTDSDNAEDLQAGLSCLDEAVRLTPTDADAWCTRGWCLGKMGRHQEEVASHSRALELDKDLAPAWAGKGSGLLMLGAIKQSWACFERALELDPTTKEGTFGKSLIVKHGLLN